MRGTTIGVALAALLMSAAPARAAEPTATVRVETPDRTLVNVQVPSDGPAVTRGDTTCEGTSPIAALDRATQGAWEGDGDGIAAILGTRPPEGTHWRYLQSQDLGPCDEHVSPGTEVVFYVGCGTVRDGCSSGDPLFLEDVPAVVRPGEPFTAKVRYAFAVGADRTGVFYSSGPREGAAITGGGAEATTGSDGAAAVILRERGPQVLRATGLQDGDVMVPASAAVCVSTGRDGYCGAPDHEAPALHLVRPPKTTADTTRALSATIGDDPSGVAAVRLALTRRRGNRCGGIGLQGGFRRITCGSPRLLDVPPAPEVGLTAKRVLGRGTYTFTAVVTDGAGNTRTMRGRFTVWEVDVVS